MNNEAKDLIDKISKISDSVKKDIKPLVQQLAKNIGDNIKHPEIINMAHAEGVKDPELVDVARILNRLRKKYDWSFSKDSLYKYVQKEYKNAQVDEYKEAPERIESILKDPERLAALEEKIKEHKRQGVPAKDIITKARVEDMEKYTWNCHVAEELAMLAIKMEHEHSATNAKGESLNQHEDKLCKDYAKKARMVRDSRFATNSNAYDAIILACNSTQSLKHSISGEWEFKTVWEVKNDEDKCRECIHENCRKESCNHECHRVVRPMTTKGLKYAIKTNDDLKALDREVKKLVSLEDDICSMGKKLLRNAKTLKLLGVKAIKRLMYSHVEKDDCLQCDLFLESHPKHFDAMEDV